MGSASLDLGRHDKTPNIAGEHTRSINGDENQALALKIHFSDVRRERCSETIPLVRAESASTSDVVIRPLHSNSDWFRLASHPHVWTMILNR